jgi:hypothetical protein
MFEILQLVAFDDHQEMVEPLPCAMAVGLSEMPAPGVGYTVSVADALAEPPGPEQVYVYEVVLPSYTSVEPEVPTPPMPVMLQLVAFVEL